MIYRNADYRNDGCDNKSTNYFHTCKIFVVLDLPPILASTFELKYRGVLCFFAQIRLLILPKLEVEHCQSRKFGQLNSTHINKKAPAQPGLFVADLAAEKGLSDAQGAPKNWNASNAMKSINN
ncbi:MAG: hypothetical protein EBR94_04525 [Bacteroidetes bacterium]|jgi:hypothetical protein|nr:hypothetical protein [Bacteroidota bacterium]